MPRCDIFSTCFVIIISLIQRFGSLALNAAIEEQEGPLYEQIAVIGGVNKFDGETGSVNANFFEILHEKVFICSVYQVIEEFYRSSFVETSKEDPVLVCR